MRRLKLISLEGTYGIARLGPGVELPTPTVGFFSVTRTAEETSIVVEESLLPALAAADRGWHCWRIAGTFDLVTETGVIASVAGPLPAAGLGLFVISTFNTDYILVKGDQFDRSVEVLRAAGHEVEATTKGPRAS